MGIKPTKTTHTVTTNKAKGQLHSDSQHNCTLFTNTKKHARVIMIDTVSRPPLFWLIIVYIFIF